MKIIFKDCIIELDYQEFQKIFPLKKGSGNYPHKSKVTDKKKKIIKKIFTAYPNRSLSSVAKELKITEDQTRYWRDKLCPI